jgi:DNA polymerase III subunit alpha
MLDGCCQVAPLTDKVLELGMPAVAITDHGVMYGAIDFYKACKQKGVKPLIGSEAYITTGSRHDRKEESQRSRMHHLVLLAKDAVGYQNLIRLASIAYVEGYYYKPRIDKEVLAKYSRGLIGLSACVKGEVNSLIVGGDVEAAARAAGQYAEILGKENFFLEIQDHGLPDQKKVLAGIDDVARKTGLPLVATNDVHYLRKEHAEAHEVLLCLQTQTVMSDPTRMRYGSDQFYLKTADEMYALFPDRQDALANTLEIAERCNVEIEFGKLHFPHFLVPAGLSQKEYLVQLGHRGIQSLYDVGNPAHPATDREREIMARFDAEIGVIEKTGFINYFLVVWDFIHFAKQQGIPVGPGRGSGGGSLVAYALGITTIDPLRYSLIFERFLNPERVSAPDFDIDFCQARRGEVIEYVKQKYGRENVAQIITFGSLGAKTVIRDVGRVLEIPFGKCDLLAKMVPDDPKMKLKLALEQNPDFRKAYETDPESKRILDYGFVLEGMYRNPGTHAAGVVIGEKPLIEIVPLALDKDDQPITQYAMEPLGELGLLKMDFLGLKTLTVIHEAVELIKELRSAPLDIDRLPLDDKPTYDLLSRGDTVGVFQLESGGMRDLIRNIRVDRIEDVIAVIALYRPGPMTMLPDYVSRKTGKTHVKYDHPLLESILKETYGVMVYQEQVQKAANVLAGYTLGGADELRRAMGKKKKEVMDKQRDIFVKGALKTNKIPEKLSEKIFDNMASFAGYGFNKAHSAGYAIISYQTAYLKANYPAEFMAALISSEIGNSDKLPVFIAEAQAMGMEILSPDVNRSAPRFRPEGNGLRFGLAGIKNVGEGAAAAIAAERIKNGPFKGLIDFMCRLDTQTVNKKTVESLVRCGAMDSLGANRARLFGGIDFAAGRAVAIDRDRRSGQISLFDSLDAGTSAGAAVPENLPDAKPWPQNEMLAGEKELLGIYLSGHPLTQYAAVLQTYQLTEIHKLNTLPERSLTRVGGIVAGMKKMVTKTKKEPMAFVTLEGLDATLEVIVFPEALSLYGAVLQQDAPIMVCGEVSRRDEPPKLIAMEIYPLADVPREFTKYVSLHLPVTQLDDARIERLVELLKKYPGKTPVNVCLQYPEGSRVFLDADASLHVQPSREFIHAFSRELGEKGLYLAPLPTPCRKATAGRQQRWGNKSGGE